jgi:molybdenum cofactor biosynthesis protein MoaC
MIDITAKTNTLRTAIAIATVRVSKQATIDAVKEKRVAKGDVFEVSRTAGLFAAKRTSDIIPDCHPLPIEFAGVTFNISGLDIIIQAEIKTIYKTGVEVEAMHVASVVALTIYDMLKPIDKNISIERIHLSSKSGGKSDLKNNLPANIRAAVIVCSDSISKSKNEDFTGKAVIQKLNNYEIDIADYIIIPDEINIIKEKAIYYSSKNIELILFCGGTGLSERDVTPEALSSLIERKIPGIEETMRAYGQERMPYAMLSRSMAGLIKNSLVLAMPGSTQGSSECIDAIFPQVLHLFKIMKGSKHD